MVFGSNAPQLREAPGRILAKILAIQCLFYLSLVGFSFIADLIFGGVPSLTNVFTSQAVTFTSPTGIAALIGSVLAAISTAMALVLIVQRAKKVLDFSATIYVVHLIFCMIISGFPVNWLWWVLQATCCTIQTLGAEYACMWREIKEMPMTKVTVV